jgi:glycosyltransferase involved in cell wall biosynthesis
VAAARKLHLPMTSSFHTNFQSYAQHYGMGLLRSPIESYLRKLHNRTLATMVPTQAMVEDLKVRGYDNVTLVSRGVEIGLFHPQRRSEALRQRWQALPDDPVVILVGRLAKEKNVGLVLEAFRAIQATQPRAKLVLVGDGPLRKSLEDACPQAHFAGIQQGEALAAHYASGDLFLFPSLTETFGNVIPEALASGLAVVAYANAAAQELIIPNHNGLLVANGDETGFVQMSVALALDAPKQQRMREAAPHSVAHLAWHAVCESFEGVLRNALTRHAHYRQSANGVALPLSPAPTEQGLSHSHLRSLR